MPKLALLFAGLLFLIAPTGAFAHAEHDFEPLSEVVKATKTQGRMLFFALPDDFETESPYLLVPADGRQIAWVPNGTQLPETAVASAPVRAIGSAPPDSLNARYLVPVLDGAGATLQFSGRRLEEGRLIGGMAGGGSVVPVLVGPQLPVSTSTTEPVFDTPIAVDMSELTEATPTLLVRRAPPSRVVFGVQLSTGYVPLIDETGVALSARHGGKLGLAVTAPADIDVPPSSDDAEEEPTGTGLAIVGAILLVVVGAPIALLVWLVRRWLRRRH